jgi:hypothetical protein
MVSVTLLSKVISMRKDYDQVFFIYQKKRDNREKSLERGEE